MYKATLTSFSASGMVGIKYPDRFNASNLFILEQYGGFLIVWHHILKPESVKCLENNGDYLHYYAHRSSQGAGSLRDRLRFFTGTLVEMTYQTFSLSIKEFIILSAHDISQNTVGFQCVRFYSFYICWDNLTQNLTG